MDFYPFWLIHDMPIINPTITLPDTIYAIEGRELNLYFANFIRSQFDLSNYQIDVSLSSANSRIKQEEKRIVYTPLSTDAGSNTLTIKISLNNSVLTTKAITLVTKTLTAGTGVTRQLAMIGDSTTAGGKVHAELIKLFSSDVMTLTEVGTNSSSVNDSGSTPRTVYHNGHTGRTIADYYSVATFPTQFDGSAGATANPFYNSGYFDFAYWQTNESITMNSGDWVFIHLGLNDVFSGMDTEAQITSKLATMKTQLDYILNNIKATVSGIRIGLCFPIGVSTSQDAFGDDYGTVSNRAWYNYCRLRMIEWMYLNYNGVSQVSLIPYHACNDSEHNCVLSSTAYNARNSTTYSKQTNALHPADSGYWQMADCLFAFLKGNET